MPNEKLIKGIIEDNTSQLFIPINDISAMQKLQITNAINEDSIATDRLTSYDTLKFSDKYQKPVLTSKRLFSFDKKKQGFVAPIGLLSNVQKVLHDYSDLELDIEDQRKDHQKYPFKLEKLDNADNIIKPYIPRKFQQPLVDKSIQKKNGMIIVGTGGGKTTIASEIIAELGQDAEFYVPNPSLLYSTAKDIKEIVPPNVHVGQIGGGKLDLQNHPNEVDINVIMLPLAQKVFNGKPINPQLKEAIIKANDMANIIIVDEAQSLSSESAKNVVASSNAKYRFGMTATPYTTNGEIDLKSAMGDTIGEVKAKELIGLSFLTKPEIYIINNSDINPTNDAELLTNLESSYCAIPEKSYMHKQIFNTKKIPTKKNKFRVQYVRKGMIECNQPRNKRIAGLVQNLTQNDKTTLVFVNSEEHGKKLLNELKELDISASLFTGKTEKDVVLTPEEIKGNIGTIKKREALFNRVKQGTLKTIITTPRLMGAGVSINGIDSIIYADMGKSKVDAVQSVGRALRLKKGKDKALIFDFKDEGYKDATYLDKWGKERVNAWNDEAYPMFPINNSEIDIIIPKKKK